MTVQDENLKRLAEMGVGREPGFSESTALGYATKPFSSSAGMVSLTVPSGAGTAVKAAVEVMLRENPHRRTGRCTIDVFDAATTYTVTIDGNAHAEVGDTDIETTIDNLVADVNGGDPGAHGVPETEFGDFELEITGFDAATTYDAIINSVTVGVTGTTDADTTAAALKTALEADSRIKDLFTFTVAGAVITGVNKTNESYTLDAADTGGTGTIVFRAIPVRASRAGSGAASKLLLQATHAKAVTIVATQASGTGRWSLAADATTMTFALWGLNTGRTYPGTLTAKQWVIDEDDPTWMERIDCAGLTHLGVEVRSTDGLTRWAVGPADVE